MMLVRTVALPFKLRLLQILVCAAKVDLDALHAKLQNLLATAGNDDGGGGAEAVEPKLHELVLHVEAEFEGGDKSDQVRDLLAQAHYNHGVMLGKLGRAREGVVSLERVNELFPDTGDVLFTLAYLMKQAGSMDKLKIVKLLDRATTLEPGNVNLLAQLGDAFLDAGMVDKAIETLGNALALASDPMPMVHASLATAYSEAGSLQLAVNEYGLAIENAKSKDQVATLAFNRGVILEKMHLLVEAVESLSMSVAAMPEAVLPRRSLGLILHRMGRDTEAMGVFEELLKIEEQDKKFIVHLQLAVVLKHILVGQQSDREAAQAIAQSHIEEAKELWSELAKPGVLMNLGLEGDEDQALQFRTHAQSSNQTLQQLVLSCDREHEKDGDCFARIHADVLAGWGNDASCEEDTNAMILSERCWEWQLRTMERWGRLRRLISTDDNHKKEGPTYIWQHWRDRIRQFFGSSDGGNHKKEGPIYHWQHCLPCSAGNKRYGAVEPKSSAINFLQLEETIASVNSGGMSWQTAWQKMLEDGLLVGPEDSAEKAADVFRTFGMVKIRNAIAPGIAAGASPYLDRSASMSLPSSTEYVHKPAHRVQLRMWPQEAPAWSAMVAAVFGGPVGGMLESLLGPRAHLVESGAFVINYGASDQSLHRDWQRGSCYNCQKACEAKESAASSSVGKARGECLSNEQCLECLRLFQDLDSASHPVVTCQVLLSHASADRAALFTIPFSHESSRYRSVLEPMVNRGTVKEQPVLGTAGDVVCYDVTLLHRGGAFNNSEDLTPRRIATFSFLPSDASSVPMGANFVIPNQAIGLWDINRLRNPLAKQHLEQTEL